MKIKLRKINHDIPMQLLHEVSDPVTSKVLHTRGEFIDKNDIERLIREYSIDNIDAIYVAMHSLR